MDFNFFFKHHEDVFRSAVEVLCCEGLAAPAVEDLPPPAPGGVGRLQIA